MQWLVELFSGHSAAQAVAILCAVGALGLALGSIRVFGVSLGIGGVLFAGLFFGHFNISLDEDVMEFVREFGLILFVYTIGMQVGPGFFSSLRRHGLQLNLLCSAIVILGLALAVAINRLGGVPAPVVSGIFAGATTNTPALAAAQQALKDVANLPPDAVTQPALAYALAYPFGIIGIIITMLFVKFAFRVDPQAEAHQFLQQQAAAIPQPVTMNIEVQNHNLDGLPLEKVPLYAESGVVVSRVLHGNEVVVAQPDTIIHVGDVLLAVGPKEKLEDFKLVVGRETSTDLRRIPSHITTRRVIVTKKSAVGKSIDELETPKLYDVAITRVSRAEIEFTPTPDFRLQFGDTVLAVGEESAIRRVAAELGDSPKQLNHPQMVPILVGIVLGVILGSCPFYFPGMPAPVRLGLAGGPLIVAIILSRLGRLGPLVWYMPISANFMMREIGIVLFLACVGLRAGHQFLATLLQGNGLLWMGYGALITLVPMLLVALVARGYLKQNFASLCGVLAGSMTDPPALAFAGQVTGSEVPYITYATVYPLTMLLRVLGAQALVIALTQVAS
jgi:putative transport protein